LKGPFGFKANVMRSLGSKKNSIMRDFYFLNSSHIIRLTFPKYALSNLILYPHSKGLRRKYMGA